MDEITLEQCPENMQEEIQMFLREKCELIGIRICSTPGIASRSFDISYIAYLAQDSFIWIMIKCDRYGVSTNYIDGIDLEMFLSSKTAYQTVEKYMKKTPCPKTQRHEKTNN